MCDLRCLWEGEKSLMLGNASDSCVTEGVGDHGSEGRSQCSYKICC